MRRATLIAALAMALPVTAAAQDNAAPAIPPSAPAIGGEAAPAPALFQASGSRTKRRGSMVGYIEDATIRTEVRVRFDAGWGIDSPDRAEFFYGKCGCYRDLAGSPLLDPDAPGPGPGIVTDMWFRQFNVLASYAVTPRLAVFGELPFRFINPESFVANTGSFDSQKGLGDINAGAKFSVLSDDTRDVTVLLRASFPSGDSLKGLGTDHASIEPALLYRQDFNDRVSIESQFGLWNPIGGSRGPQPTDDDFSGSILYYGIGPSFDLVSTDRFRLSPVVELVGWHVLSGFETSTLLTPLGGDAKGVDVVNLKFGARTSWGSGGSIYAGFGVALTDAKWYDKVFRLEYRAGF